MAYFGFNLNEYANFIILANYVEDESAQQITHPHALESMAKFIITNPPEYRIKFHPLTISGIRAKLIDILPDNKDDKITLDFHNTLFNKLIEIGIINRETLTPTTSNRGDLTPTISPRGGRTKGRKKLKSKKSLKRKNGSYSDKTYS